MHRFIRPVLTLSMCAAVLLGAMVAWAAITGSISGIVTDPSGAVVSGVTVVATSEETGVQSTTVTDAKGFYNLPTLAIGHYDVAISHPGFSNFLDKAVVINANSDVRVDAKLTIGATSKTVTVNANRLQIETQSTQMGEVIGADKITSVPLNGRSFISLLDLQPGVSPNQGTTFSTGIGAAGTVSGQLANGSVAVSGGRENSNGWMVNGGDAEEGVQNGAAIIPNLDSIAQFRIITNNFDAEYGNFSGGQINVATKAGTNQYHGNAFEFLRNTNFNARDFFATARSPYKQNQFGGTFGGPIKRDKVFFFADYQGTRHNVAETENFPVPTPADRTQLPNGGYSLIDQSASFAQGDPSNGGQGVGGAYWANILSKELGYTVVPGEAYYTPGCTTSDPTTGCVFPNAVIPGSAINPVAANTLKYILPGNTQNGTYYTNSSLASTNADNKGAIRVDANTRFGAVFVYYFLDKYVSTNPYGGGTFPGFASTNNGLSQYANIGLTTTLNASTVNDVRFTYLRDVNLANDPVGGLGVSQASLGFVTPWGPAGGISPSNPTFAGVPQFDFLNYSFGVVSGPLRQYNNTAQILDNFTKVMGTHTFQAGVDGHYDQINERNTFNQNGTFSFYGNETGLDFADYLIGAPSQFNQDSTQILDSRSLYFGAYAQDSWRVLHNLTLNYGLRYEITTPWYDTQNKLETLIPGEQSLSFPGAPLGLVMPGDPGVPRTLSPIRYNNFAPRVGIAYTPNATDGWLGKLVGPTGTTSIRTGYGIFYTNIEDVTGFVEIGDPPYGNAWGSPVPPLLQTPFIDRGTGFNEGVKFPFVFPPTNVSPKNPYSGFNWPAVLPISGADYVYPGNVTPSVQEFELSLQRQLGSATVLSVSYVGSVGRHLIGFIEANPGNPALCLQLMNPANVAPGSPTCGPEGEQNVYTTASGQTINSTRQPFGANFGSDPYMRTYGSSNFNSLQVSLKHQDKYDNFLLAYTWEKSMDNNSTLLNGDNPYDTSLGYQISAFDVPQTFVASYTVQVPFYLLFGKGAVARRFTGGWAVSGITTYAVGLPIQFGEGDDRSLIGCFYSGGCDRPSYANNGTKYSGDKNPRHRNAYFNPNFFTTEPLGQEGNVRSDRFGPGIDNYDLALLKNTKIVGDTQLQLRMEAFNAFNHAQFGDPGGNVNNNYVGGFGYTNGDSGPRVVQIAAKFLF